MCLELDCLACKGFMDMGVIGVCRGSKGSRPRWRTGDLWNEVRADGVGPGCQEGYWRVWNLSCRQRRAMASS